MKLSKAIALCKKQKHITLYNTKDMQYISDGYGIYPLIGMPRFDKATIYSLFEIPTDDIDKYIVMTGSFPEEIDTSDTDDYEQEITEVFYNFIHNGEEIKTVVTGKGECLFFRRKNILPYSKTPGYSYFIRHVESNGAPYMVVKEGMLFVGAIIPVNIINDRFIHELNNFRAAVINQSINDIADEEWQSIYGLAAPGLDKANNDTEYEQLEMPLDEAEDEESEDSEK